jgi:phosphoribosyl 1,2-cyclic phosphodiesterase
MKIHFWGTRGSIPVSLTTQDIRHKLATALQAANGRSFASRAEIDQFIAGLGFDVSGTFGGHSSCVQLITDRPEHCILDLGSGVRPLGQHILQCHGPATAQVYHVFLSHLHWDHIMGFPFFTPAYLPGNRIVIHSGHPNAEFALRRQQENPSFPVSFDHMGADIEFVMHEPGVTQTVAGMKVDLKKQHHGGDSYGWRFDYQGTRVIYTTDSEYQVGDREEHDSFVAFFRNADAVIFDAMYSLAEAVSVKADWGHSSNTVAVEMCLAANVKRLFLFHHEPAHNDSQIEQIRLESRRYEEIMREGNPLEVNAAWDGLELEV